MLKIHEKVTKVVKDRKLEDIVKDLPPKLTKLAKDETQTIYQRSQ